MVGVSVIMGPVAVVRMNVFLVGPVELFMQSRGHCQHGQAQHRADQKQRHRPVPDVAGTEDGWAVVHGCEEVVCGQSSEVVKRCFCAGDGIRKEVDDL